MQYLLHDGCGASQFMDINPQQHICFERLPTIIQKSSLKSPCMYLSRIITEENKLLVQCYWRNNSSLSTIWFQRGTCFKSPPWPAASAGSSGPLHTSGVFGEDMMMSRLIDTRDPPRRLCCAQNKSCWK